MEPFVSLMRRYCIDYTSAHNQSVCDEIMADDYTVTISGRALGMDEYRRAVSAAYERYPTLMLSTHELLLSGDRLAMRFSEHGATAQPPKSVAVWQGISLYRWDGDRLKSCRVEQDFLGRDAQGSTGTAAQLEAPHPDPWATTRELPRDREAESLIRRWISDMADAPSEAIGDERTSLLEFGSSAQPLLVEQEVSIDELFSAGSSVAAAITITGSYDGGLAELDDSIRGAVGVMPATLIADVEGGSIREVKMVRDRWGLVRRLRSSTRD